MRQFQLTQIGCDFEDAAAFRAAGLLRDEITARIPEAPALAESGDIQLLCDSTITGKDAYRITADGAKLIFSAKGRRAFA